MTGRRGQGESEEVRERVRAQGSGLTKSMVTSLHFLPLAAGSHSTI